MTDPNPILNAQPDDFGETVQMPPIQPAPAPVVQQPVVSQSVQQPQPQAFIPAQQLQYMQQQPYRPQLPPQPIVLEGYDGKLVVDPVEQAVVIRRSRDSALHYRSDLTVIPFRSIIGAKILYSEEYCVVSFDVMLPNGKPSGYLEQVDKYWRDVYTMPADGDEIARDVVEEVKKNIVGERVPLRQTPFRFPKWWMSPWPYATLFFAVLTVLAFTLGHAFITPSPGNTKTTPPVVVSTEPTNVTPSPSNSTTTILPSDTPSPSDSASSTPSESASPSTSPTVSEADQAKAAAEKFRNQPVSRRSVISQLQQIGYSADVAASAVDSMGVDWSQHAINAAKIYRNAYSWDASQISGKLVADGFSASEVNAAIAALG